MKKLEFVQIKEEYRSEFSEKCRNNYFLIISNTFGFSTLLSITMTGLKYHFVYVDIESKKLVAAPECTKLPFIEYLSYKQYKNYVEYILC